MFAELEALLFAAALSAIVLLVSAKLLTRLLAVVLAVAVFAVAFIGGSVWQATTSMRAEEFQKFRPIENPINHYVSSTACRACHPQHYASWHASYHRSMTQLANPDSVVGTFDDQPFVLKGKTYRLQRRGDQYWAELDGSDPDGKAIRYWTRLVMTTGSHHQQVYWYSTGDTRVLGQLPIVYLIDEQRWVPRESAFLRPPQETSTSETGRWNTACNQCHATHSRPGFFDEHTMDTQVAELGIACEACHGPAEQHVQANHNPLFRYQQHLAADALDTDQDAPIRNPAKMPHRRSTEVCGQCHGVAWFHNEQDWQKWLQEGLPYRPGDTLADSRYLCQISNSSELPPEVVSRLEQDPMFLANRFWSDGMIRISGREYSGLLNTPCYQQGEMSCLSCHRMHQASDDDRPLDAWRNDQLQREMESDHACLQCHTNIAESITAHTHHAADSSGSRCYNCHMPHTTYGLLKAIRSHQIDSPNATVTAEVGRPNACNLCHLDKTLGWTANQLTEWYDHERPELTENQETISAAVLDLLTGDAGRRALASWHMGWQPAQQASGTTWMTPVLATGLADPYEAVRIITHRRLKELTETGLEYDFLAPPEQRDQAIQEIIQDWQRRNARDNQRRGRAVLLDDDGNLEFDELQKLIGQRDNTPLSLAE
ncbi:MAG TPA: C cytochrome precursor [Planctomycetaceae bacterium]|nr:C cytochrome precursor [Planctomycetaceae bacterium]